MIQKMEDCIFCKIIKGEIPAAKVYDDDKYLAFLSIAPINPGHTLVISKRHIGYFFDLEDQEIGDIMVVSKNIAQVLKKAFNPQTGKIGIMVAGGEVPHTHVHLIPMDHETDLDFKRQKLDTPFTEIQSNAQKIKENL
ncbi:MAG: HIT family hydrolase, diadenosine tetraphosphate hydrolase [Candidatus Daviesbacteria bacterium GW2011_GWA1_41_61]|uniref:HIT family hydrolase, diadenosine tetraphosphate hydrolase n=1 Tax=Candidatus Daviesbacteria bacterium GW2011_GWA2_40_9 TaxID=1618424 RepID=A0A0G0X4Z3_9BACT|nr:MAG: HIT family hydrolase, diadenosine tetraphosphate hydrolase [Candidatus Daviesbacteria bacterium GW2011_GWC1_40_9]KKR82687.1 MAG: HIT family hydrolase, diadenosine tetraphosphate hydrolase [Candidatus Daviesbacteria bacterium GW2011_GWA2_40_9]KKR93357.1 MAG: HIT family hydrolase, diadenosine tetraphosphate hydrolase [Candidatus Daviesbacteria bacterium GW2011_GWB1_41_15]KKS15094.1 MAG: HIT family hydrolase, diadenosine tetraphosphate hydrolase [Candidatus Daviesbacteria bacterium GW2011_G